MRNKYPGRCYKCDKWVDAGDGHFERHQGAWCVQCLDHTKRNTADPDRLARIKEEKNIG